VDVGKVIGTEVIAHRVNQRGGDTVHGDQVPVPSGGQANVNTGIRGESLQIALLLRKEGAIEEKLRLDVALPQSAVFVIAVRRLDAPNLTVTDLYPVVSTDGSIFRTAEYDVVKYRIDITGAGFDVTSSSYLLNCVRRKTLAPRVFREALTACRRISRRWSARSADEVDHRGRNSRNVQLACWRRMCWEATTVERTTYESGMTS
jgi:hypothetical protein